MIIGETTDKLKRRNPPSSRSRVALKRQQRFSPVPGYALGPSQFGVCSGFRPHALPMFPAPLSPQMKRQSLVGMSSTVNCSSSLPHPTPVLPRPIPSARCLVPSSPDKALPIHCHGFGFLQPSYPQLSPFSLGYPRFPLESQWLTSMSSSPF